MAKFYVCETCGKIVGLVKEGTPETICCGHPMVELGPKESGEGEAKHVPVVTEEGGLVKVKVGEVEHPMMDNHYIDWVYLLTDQGAQRKVLHPGSAPEATFHIGENEVVLAVYAHCNIHGLWKAKI